MSSKKTRYAVFVGAMIVSAVCAAGVAVQDNRPFNAFYFASGIVADSRNNIYVCGMSNKIIKISPQGVATDFAGSLQSYFGHKDGKGPAALFETPRHMAIDSDNNIYVTEPASIRKVTPAGEVTTLAGYTGAVVRDGPIKTAGFRDLQFIAVGENGEIYVTDGDVDPATRLEHGVIRKISAQREVSTLKTPDGSVIILKYPGGLASDKQGNILVCDREGRCIRRVSPDGTVTVVAGKCGSRQSHPVYKEGDVSTAELMTPSCLILGRNGELVFSDTRLNRIIRIAGGKVETLAGNSPIDYGGGNIGGYSEAGYRDGKAKLALFDFPNGITFDSAGNLFIVDTGNKCIRKLSPDGIVSTFYK